MEGRWLTVKDIAHELQVKEETVAGWIREKKLAAYKVGREYRVKVSDYERYLAERRTIDDLKDRD